MTTGSKVAILLIVLAAASLGTGFFMLIRGAQTPDPVPRADVDLDAVAELFAEEVKSLSQLPAFAAAATEAQVHEGDEPVRVTQLSDCSVLGWIDKNGDDQPEVRYTADEAAQIKPDEPPDGPEVLFRLRAEQRGQRLLLADRYHTMREHKVSDAYTSTDAWRELLACQERHYGRHYYAPGYWIFVHRGYYGGWSSARSASLGRRAGTGGVGGGK